MSNAKSVSVGASIGFGSLLTLVFVAAKLWGKIDWSWWWVCAPIWGPTAAVLAALAIFVVFAGVLWCFGAAGEAIGRALKGRRDNNL